MARYRFNFIAEIQNMKDENQYTDHGIEHAFIEYFLNIYSYVDENQWMIGNLNWRKIKEDQAVFLIVPSQTLKF